MVGRSVALYRRGFTVTAAAGKEGDECNPIMAHAAILATENVRHANACASGDRCERCRMAVRAGQPACVRTMGKAYMRHFLRVLHDDVEIEHFHLLRSSKIAARPDQAFVERAHPVGKSVGIVGQVSGRLVYPLQACCVRVVRIVDIGFVQGPPCKVSGAGCGCSRRCVGGGDRVFRGGAKECRGVQRMDHAQQDARLYRKQRQVSQDPPLPFFHQRARLPRSARTANVCLSGAERQAGCRIFPEAGMNCRNRESAGRGRAAGHAMVRRRPAGTFAAPVTVRSDDFRPGEGVFKTPVLPSAEAHG